MPFRRQQSKDIFNHLVTNVAFLEDVDPGVLALMQEGITNLSMLLSLDASDVLTWYYPFADDAGTVTNKPLPKGQQYLLKHLVNFTQMHYTSTPSAQDSEAVWTSLHNGHFMAYMAQPVTPPILVPPTPPASSNGTDLFHKGNKRDRYSNLTTSCCRLFS